MRVLHLHWNPCQRVYKVASLARDHDLSLVTVDGKEGPPFTEVHRFDYHHHDSLVGLIWELAPDIVHSHNEPDIFTVKALEADVPVVHDVHDFMSFHFDPVQAQSMFDYDPVEMEYASQTETAAVVYATPVFQMWGDAIYCPKRHVVIESRVPIDRFVAKQKRGPKKAKLSVVYQGGIGTKDNGYGYPYRRYGNLFRRLIKMGAFIGVHPAPTCPPLSIGEVAIYDTLPHDELLYEMTAYHYAFMGFATEHCDRRMRRYCDACLPNKFFDAMAASIPIIVHGAKLIEELVRKHEVGIVWDGESDIAQEAREKWPMLRDNVKEKREMFAMEEQSQKLLDLYEELV